MIVFDVHVSIVLPKDFFTWDSGLVAINTNVGLAWLLPTEVLQTQDCTHRLLTTSFLNLAARARLALFFLSLLAAACSSSFSLVFCGFSTTEFMVKMKMHKKYNPTYYMLCIYWICTSICHNLSDVWDIKKIYMLQF